MAPPLLQKYTIEGGTKETLLALHTHALSSTTLVASASGAF
jgi:hypothetical protein